MKEHLEYLTKLDDAEDKVKEIKASIPAYYKFYLEMKVACFEKHWYGKKMDDDPHREKTQEIRYSTFNEFMERWNKLSFPESKKVWELVKEHNANYPKFKDMCFDEEKMYKAIKKIQEKTK